MLVDRLDTIRRQRDSELRAGWANQRCTSKITNADFRGSSVIGASSLIRRSSFILSWSVINDRFPFMRPISVGFGLDPRETGKENSASILEGQRIYLRDWRTHPAGPLIGSSVRKNLDRVSVWIAEVHAVADAMVFQLVDVNASFFQETIRPT